MTWRERPTATCEARSGLRAIQNSLQCNNRGLVCGRTVKEGQVMPLMKGTAHQLESITIRDEAPGDQPAIHEVHALAFSGPAGAKLVDEVRQSGDLVISLVAAEGDLILGHILLSKLEAPMRALALAPVAVHPDFQRQGIGSAMIRKGLENAGHDGWEAVFVLGDVCYYSRFGFSVQAAKGDFSPYSGEHFMMLQLGPREILTSGRLVYPAPFRSSGLS